MIGRETMIDEIKTLVQEAAGRRQKLAVPASYQIEFRKMISLARLMSELGVSHTSN